MNKDFLKGVDKEVKKAFLNKLQSKKFILGAIYEPQKQMTFDLIPESGLYRCQETGEIMSRDQVNHLQGFRFDIDVISTRDQVEGNEPPDSIVKVPFMESEYLDSLLIDKSSKVLTWDPESEKFKTDSDSYSFAELMEKKHSIPEPDFIMDEATARKYAECLEKWC